MNGLIKVLFVEDVAEEVELALRELRRNGLSVEARCVDTRERYLEEIDDFKPDIILSDFSLPKFDGLSALAIARDQCAHIPFMFLSGTMVEETAIGALKDGAIDYILKTNIQRLPAAVRRAVNEYRTRVARQQAESRFRDLIEFSPDAIVVLNEQGRIEIVNAQLESLFGYSRDQIVGAFSDVLIPERFRLWHDVIGRRDDDDRRDKSLQLQQPAQGFEASGKRKDGTEFPVEIIMSPLKTEMGLWISTVIRDITERKAQQSRMVRLNRIHTVLSRINTAIVRIKDKKQFLDEACRIAVDGGQFTVATISMLDAATQLLHPEAWAGSNGDFLVGVTVSIDEKLPEGRGMMGQAMRSGLATVSHDIVNDSRVALWQNIYAATGFQSGFVIPLFVGGKAVGILGLFAIGTDVFNDEEQRLLSELAADISFALDHFGKEAQLNFLAYFDPFTGLPNQALFLNRIGQLIVEKSASENGHIAVVMVDLERFSSINDIFGRQVGDEVLREVGKRLQACIGDTSYLARISGDSFGIVIKDNTDGSEVIALLERKIALRLAEPMPMIDQDIRLNIRAGIALFPSDGTDADGLLLQAKAALKNAKMSNAHYLFYTEEMNRHTAARLSLENSLRRAIDEQQFMLHYQPKVEIGSGRISSVEALIRWNHPERGLVSPAEFIPILEETGLIIPVGTWVINTACKQIAEWISCGIGPVHVSVNVSGRQFFDNGLEEEILKAIKINDIDPTLLELELTETSVMSNAENTIAVLRNLKAVGVQISIDDFGTGYSSLAYLKRFPIDTIKIDIAFVRDITSNPEDAAIVSAIISMAHSLKLRVVAEGVETVAQLAHLRRRQCDAIQGYYFSRPVSAEAFEQLVLQQKCLPTGVDSAPHSYQFLG